MILIWKWRVEQCERNIGMNWYELKTWRDDLNLIQASTSSSILQQEDR